MEREQALLALPLLLRTLISSWGHTLMTSSKSNYSFPLAPFQIPSHRGLGLQHIHLSRYIIQFTTIIIRDKRLNTKFSFGRKRFKLTSPVLSATRNAGKQNILISWKQQVCRFWQILGWDIDLGVRCRAELWEQMILLVETAAKDNLRKLYI